MGKYLVELSDKAKFDLQKFKKSGNKIALAKITRIFEDLENNPFSGVGQPEQLKHLLHGYWSRRINQKDRLIYRVFEDKVLVEVVSAMGHYSDK
jgi:toxin YoeB